MSELDSDLKLYRKIAHLLANIRIDTMIKNGKEIYNELLLKHERVLKKLAKKLNIEVLI